MLVVRSLRQDRVTFCVASFITDNLGVSFVEPPALDMKAVSVVHLQLLDTSNWDVCISVVLTDCCRCCEQVVEESSCRTPLIFVLSPGVDPTGALLQLAETSGMKDDFHALSLGQGQAPIARRMIEEGVEKGTAASHTDLACNDDLRVASAARFSAQVTGFSSLTATSRSHGCLSWTSWWSSSRWSSLTPTSDSGLVRRHIRTSPSRSCSLASS